MLELNLETAGIAVGEFLTKWNQGDLEGACEIYAEDAAMVTPKGYVRGKQAIINAYRASYKDRAAMGMLTNELIEFRIAPGPNPTMASAMLKWTWSTKQGKKDSGYVLETYMLLDGKILIVQDASM